MLPSSLLTTTEKVSLFSTLLSGKVGMQAQCAREEFSGVMVRGENVTA